MIKIRIRNSGHEIDIRFPLSESELFWNSGDNYSIMTRDELDAYIDNQGMTMGGM